MLTKFWRAELIQFALLIGAFLVTGRTVSADSIQTPSAGTVTVSGEAFWQDLASAVEAGARSIKIEPGVYRMTPANGSNLHGRLRNARGVEIDATGVTIIFTDPSATGLIFDNCSNLTIRGLTLDYDPLPFTQGVVEAIDAENGTYTVRLDKGYSQDMDFFGGSRVAAYIYDPADRQLKTGAWDLYPSKIEPVEPGLWQVFLSKGVVERNPVVPGDLMMISRRAAGAVRFLGCERVNVSGWTIYSAPGIAIQEANGEGGSRYQYTVTRGPLPKGASSPRLHSSNADAFHSAYVRNGPIVENCLFEYQGDDGVAIHGTYALVGEASSDNTILVSPKYELPLAVGDELRVLDGNGTWDLKATANVTAIKRLESPTGETLDTVRQLWEKYRSDVKGRSFYEVTLDRPTDVAVGDLVSSFQRCGAGFIVRNNTIRHHRARGILVKAPDGIVEHNILEDNSFAAIAIGPELSTWLGGDYAQNVVIRDNILRRSGRHGNIIGNANATMAGALTVQAITLDRGFAKGHQNRYLVIEDNLIEDASALAMVLTSLRDVVVRNNRIVNPGQLDQGVAGSQTGYASDAAIFVAEAENVLFDGNTFELNAGRTRDIASAAIDTDRAPTHQNLP